MKNNAPSLIDVAQEFATEEKCLAYLEAMRWPDGVECPACEGKKISKFITKEGVRKKKNKAGQVVEVKVPARHLYQCLDCDRQFTAGVGTIFNDSHLPLHKWFMATALMINAKKGLSAKQMERDLGVNYRTAWYLNHRIRKAMEDGNPGVMTGGVVECDETFVGGEFDRRRKRSRYGKQAVVGMLQRKTEDSCSKVRSFPIKTNSKAVLTAAVRGNVSTDVTMFVTDEWSAYKSLGKTYPHETVNHIALEYVRKGDSRSVHTNSIENFWSLFKRGLIGSFHQVSVKHLRR